MSHEEHVLESTSSTHTQSPQEGLGRGVGDGGRGEAVVGIPLRQLLHWLRVYLALNHALAHL